MSAFDQLAAKLAQRKGVSDPRALAASIGRKKYGASNMAQAGSEGVSVKAVLRQQRRGK